MNVVSCGYYILNVQAGNTPIFNRIFFFLICSDGSSSTGSGSRSSYSSKSSNSQSSRNAHKANMAALKSAFQGDDSSGDEGSKDATAEEEDWQQAFAMMKKTYTPKVEEVVVQTDQKFVKRQNVAHLEVRLINFMLKFTALWWFLYAFDMYTLYEPTVYFFDYCSLSKVLHYYLCLLCKNTLFCRTRWTWCKATSFSTNSKNSF